MPFRFYDAHNHLQEERLSPHRATIVPMLRESGVARVVVNGGVEEDWPDVLALAKDYPDVVVPSFGLHPWYVRERSSRWLERLQQHLEAVPSAVGEIGLDRWIKDHDVAQQEEVFLAQWHLADTRNLPVSIHCLQAWGRLVEILEAEARSNCGFLLHSYGGSAELVPRLADLGAYFSISGYFAHARKARQQDVFRSIPADRLLIETDAPDMLPPDDLILHPLADAGGKPVNHPGNLPAIYDFVARLRGVPLAELVNQVEKNFQRLFGGLFPRA